MKWIRRERFCASNLEESTDEISNPACGWYRMHTFEADSEREVSEILDSLCREDRLVLLRIRIPARKDRLEPSEISFIEKVLRIFIHTGKEILLRFVYDLEGKGLENEPDSFEIVQTHLRQLMRLIHPYEKDIFLYQGVLIGSWGEMHTSRFLSPEQLYELHGVIEEETEGIFHAVRKPSQWRQIHPQNNRTGIYNDGILGSDTDLGTYGKLSHLEAGWDQPWAAEDEFEFQQNVSERAPYGGEVVYEKTADSIPLSQAVQQLAKRNITYLNRDYDGQLLEHWRRQVWMEQDIWNGMNGFDYIGRHLGYRFVVREAKWVRNRKRRETGLECTIENVGFARMYQESDLYVEFEDMAGNRESQRISVDVRKWKPKGCVTIFCPMEPKAGHYFLLIRRRRDGRVISFANRHLDQGRVLLGELTVS